MIVCVLESCIGIPERQVYFVESSEIVDPHLRDLIEHKDTIELCMDNAQELLMAAQVYLPSFVDHQIDVWI